MGSLFYVGSMFYVGCIACNNTRSSVTDREDFMLLKYRTCFTPKQETTEPVFHYYNLVNRHGLQLLLLPHMVDCFGGFRLSTGDLNISLEVANVPLTGSSA